MAKHNDQAAIKLVERAATEYEVLEEQLERMKDEYAVKYGEDIDAPQYSTKKKRKKTSS